MEKTVFHKLESIKTSGKQIICKGVEKNRFLKMFFWESSAN